MMRPIKVLSFLALLMPTLLVAFANIYTVAASADLIQVAAQIEKGVIVESSAVSTLISSSKIKFALQSCSADVTSSLETLQNYILNTKGISTKDVRQSKELQDAYEYNMHRLSCYPADGTAWLIRAEIAESKGSNAEPLNSSLAYSASYAPAEIATLSARIAFVQQIQTSLDIDRMKILSDDIEKFATGAPIDRIAKGYVQAKSDQQEIYFSAIRKLPQLRRNAIAGAVNRMGGTIRSAKCSTVENMKPDQYTIPREGEFIDCN